MRVTVIGSHRKDNPALRGTTEEFEKACRAIGARLASLGHRLVVPHPDHRETADLFALHGFQTVNADRYYICNEHAGDPPLKAHFDAVERSDAVIPIGGHNATYAAGLGALRRRKLVLPIPTFGGSAKELCDIPEIDRMLIDQVRNLDLGQEIWERKLVEAVERFLKAYPRVLIIHGRGDPGVELRNHVCAKRTAHDRLDGIAAPLIMDLSGKGAISVPDVFENLASQVSAAVAIVTSDDVGGFARGDGDEVVPATRLVLESRARENVWVEVGWFWGRLGRERVFLWLQDDVELPSDLQGAAWTRAKDLSAAWPSIEAFLDNLRHPDELEYNSGQNPPGSDARLS